MFNHYKVFTIRNLTRNKGYSFINIAGLTFGLACAMLIILYVNDEQSFDRFNKNVNHIYRIAAKSDWRKMGSGGSLQVGATGALQGPRFAQHVPGIKSFLRVKSGIEDLKTGAYVQSQRLLYVDSNFFSVFTFPLLSGDPATCLREPHSMVLSEDAAKKHFGTKDAVGKIILIKSDSTFVPYKVTAVAKRCPQNSTIQFDVLLPVKITDEEVANSENWFSFNLNTFVVLEAGANRQSVEKQMQIFYLADAQKAFDAILKNTGGPGNAKIGDTYFLQPYLDIHLSTDLPANHGLSNASNPTYSYILSGIASFVLLIACINFVNLTMARSIKRARETGVRKIAGSTNTQLIMQFLGESFFLCLVAFVLAIAFVQFLLPWFNELANKALSLSYLLDAKLLTGYIILFLITVLLAGFYPALVLSRCSPVQTLYNRFQIAGKNYLQKTLVILQFTLASFLIIATFVIYAQFDFLTKTNLGYDDNNLIIIETGDTKHADAAAFKNELMKNPDIVGVSAKNGHTWQAGAKGDLDSGINCRYETIDENYIPLLKIPLIAGRNFSPAFPADSVQSIIVNETFAKAAHWKDPIGKTVNVLWGEVETFQVVGVVKDYHFESLNEKIMPQLITMKTGNLYGAYYIKIKPGTATAGLKWIQKLFQQFYPMDPYSYVFKNDDNKKQYAEIEKWKQLVLFGSILTIFISCIGLFGLSVLSAEKRKKEIGIRKVLGASVQHIVTKLSTDFMKLVLLALIVAAPLAYIAANKWLENFPYRIAINSWIFTDAALLVTFIALFTVSFQAVRAAIANPVKSLRTE